MSTNPFRRSSLKGPGGSSGGSDHVTASFSHDVSPIATHDPTPLSVNTKVPATNQKHVNFASPPAIPISPVSYPPSPESTRISPAYAFAKPVIPLPTNYSSALQSDPFRAEAETDESDGLLEQALLNARSNTTMAAPSVETLNQDAVKNTLSRFASTPKRPSATGRDTESSQTPTSQRPAMDVDAFKRLLLTGESGQSSRQEEVSNTVVQIAAIPINDNSSGTDTASLSQRSLFDHAPTTDESPRSSDEIDPADANLIRQTYGSSHTTDTRKKPPPPAPRHGKLIREEIVTGTVHEDAIAQTSFTPKKPPAPPLARRRSQNSGISRPTSSRKSSSSDVDQVTSLNDATSRAPPPPKSRRPISMVERRASSDLPTTQEESDSADSSRTPSNRVASDPRPTPPPARNSSKRASLGPVNAPPLPPPRRGRGSSRSSIDSQRPQLSTILGSSSIEAASADSLQSGVEGRRVSSSSAANDILADLAALQREVDRARGKVSR